MTFLPPESASEVERMRVEALDDYDQCREDRIADMAGFRPGVVFPPASRSRGVDAPLSRGELVAVVVAVAVVVGWCGWLLYLAVMVTS